MQATGATLKSLNCFYLRVSLSRLEEVWKLAKLGKLRQSPLSHKTLLASALFPTATKDLTATFPAKLSLECLPSAASMNKRTFSATGHTFVHKVQFK